jgi:hypothetical protein
MRFPSAADHPSRFFHCPAQTEGKTGRGNFEFSGPATKALLLGNVALCARARTKWERPRMKVANGSYSTTIRAAGVLLGMVARLIE